jgi:RNA polymerase sigma-70 factor (ECF subfamily)
VPGGGAPLPSDEEIVEAFARGTGAACELLYDRLVGVVEATLIRVLGKRDLQHDDLVQTAFEQIVLTLSRQRFAGACSLSSWATSVSTHVALNAIRSRTRERRVVDRSAEAKLQAEGVGARVDVERETGTRELLMHVRQHLSEMDPLRATALLLHDAFGHDLAEIAALTGVTIAAAQSRLVRARKELRERLVADGVRLSREGAP